MRYLPFTALVLAGIWFLDVWFLDVWFIGSPLVRYWGPPTLILLAVFVALNARKS